MAKILLTAFYINEDILLYIRLAKMLKTYGHDVTIIAHNTYKDLVLHIELDFVGLDTPEGYNRCIGNETLFHNLQDTASFYQEYILPKAFIEYRIIRERYHPGNTVLISSFAPGIAERSAAEYLGIPFVACFTSLQHIKTIPLVENLYSSIINNDINKIRRHIGLASVHDWYSWVRNADRFIGFWTDTLAVPVTDLQKKITLTGSIGYDDMQPLHQQASIIAICSMIEELVPKKRRTTISLKSVLGSEHISIADRRIKTSTSEAIIPPSFQQAHTLSPERQALLELRIGRMREEQMRQKAIPQVDRSNNNAFFPLSFAQQRLWFLDQIQPESPFYNVPVSYTLIGKLNVAVLDQSLQEIVRRHEVMRTNFAVIEGNPVQILKNYSSVSMVIIDMRSLPAFEWKNALDCLTTQEAQRPFNLALEPLLRVTLLRSAEDEHMLLLTMHHIIADGWSLGILMRELATLYNAYAAGRPSPLPKIHVQYVDYTAWQQERLQGSVLEALLAYWKQKLQNAPSVLELPTDRPRPATQSFRGALKSVFLPKHLHKALKTLSQHAGVTPFIVLLAAWKTLLFRYTQQEDIVVGTPIANRSRAETQGLIGFFVNTLVMRTDLGGNPSFLELIERIRNVAIEAYTHQDLPFEKLVEELHPRRDMSHMPVVQVMFSLQNASMENLAFSGVHVTSRDTIPTGTATFDLTLSLKEQIEGISCLLEYSTDLFDEATIERMLGHFQTLLESIITNPNCRIVELRLLTEDERYQMLASWNDTSTEYSGKRCLHHLFEEQVERTPDIIALVYENQQITYEALNRRVNQLAHHLQKLEVGPDVLVGICVEHSLEMVVGILGILKAAGAYVPLDPNYPSERLAFMLEDTRIHILLTQQQLLNRLPRHYIQIVCLDSDWEDISNESRENLDSKIEIDNLAYVIFTSGSAGIPKGVMIQHGSLHDRIVSLTKIYRFDRDNRLLQFVSISFDASAEEIFPTLLCGATLVMHPNPRELSADELLHEGERLGVTALHLPPVYWEQLIGNLTSLQHPIPKWMTLFSTGGESLSVESLLTWTHLMNHPSRFINAYGPTETTITATVYEPTMELAAVRKLSRVPIGRPLTNTQVYILDRQLQPVPIGVVGELYIGGSGLARGYLNCADLTAERFIPDPFSDKPGVRLYRTGDLTRYLHDGNIEFLGRADNQVKVRGFRIELGDIETILNQHSILRQAIVTVQGNSPSNKRLVAYIVPKEQFVPTASELHRFLQERLPQYMIPSTFVLLHTLPLTPNGKVNRKALPPSDATTLELLANYIEPCTQIEQVLAEIWSRVLDTNRIGVHDNFFELGGHSLLATQVMSRVRDRFQIEIPLRSFFDAPTIADLADLITQIKIRQEESQETIRLLETLEQMSEEEAQQRLNKAHLKVDSSKE